MIPSAWHERTVFKLAKEEPIEDFFFDKNAPIVGKRKRVAVDRTEIKRRRKQRLKNQKR